MYITSLEVIRAFRTPVIDDQWIKEDYQCRNGPCGPNANPSLHRSQCCFHPFNDEYTDGKVVYECCALKCLRELKCDIRTTHITTMYHRTFGDARVFSSTKGFLNHIRARFVCLVGGNATGPTGPVEGRELSQLRYNTYSFPMHIGAETSELTDHTLQARYNMSLDSEPDHYRIALI